MLGRLCKAAETVCWSEFEVLFFKTVFSIAFVATLRISELVPTPKHKKGGLQWEDVLVSGASVKICIRQ